MIRLFAELSSASFEGGREHETELQFQAAPVRAGGYRAELPTDESVVPLLQAAAVPLGLADGESELVLEGTTHAAGEATFEVASSAWLPLMRKIGFDVELELERAGFAPRGGGALRFRARGRPESLRGLDLERKGEISAIEIISAGASVPTHVQQRQAARARSGLLISGLAPSVQLLKLPSGGRGSVVAVTGVFGGLPATFAGIAARGVSAEAVGEQVAREFRHFLNHPAAVPPFLMEPLLLALSSVPEGSTLSTSKLPAAVPGVAGLARRFCDRGVGVEGKVGKAARLTLEPVASS